MPIGARSRSLAPLGFVGWHVILPLVLGSFLYVAFRSQTLLMFTWAQSLGLAPVVELVRETAVPLAFGLPEWVIYSLPNALWAYSLTAWLTRLWGKEQTTWKWLFLLAGPLLSVGVESGQALAWISGTFCWQDLSFAVCACALGAFIGLRTVRSSFPTHSTV